MLFKRLSRTLFPLTPSRSPSPYSSIAQCSTSSPSHPEVSVWWDLDNCTVPPGVNGAQAITAAIESSGIKIKGPIQITAFGDMVRFARTNRETISSTDINFTHIPDGMVDSANKALFMYLMFWVSQNPPPAHFFLIIVDRGYASLLHSLRVENYNILLASKESAPAPLRSAATIMWNWDALVRGENLTGRYFNQPPMVSWYGHYEGPLEDPFTEIERPAFAPDDKLGEVQTQELFSQDSFWRDLQTFINTAVGSLIVAESRTREKMAYYLQKYGPSVLKSVTKSDVLLLVDMLISEKKWVRESPYLSRPLKLTSSVGITSANSDCTYSDYDFAYSEDEF